MKREELRIKHHNTNCELQSRSLIMNYELCIMNYQHRAA
jgi:hypothetical protein